MIELKKIKCIDCGAERTVLPQHEKTVVRCEDCSLKRFKANQARRQREWVDRNKALKEDTK